MKARIAGIVGAVVIAYFVGVMEVLSVAQEEKTTLGIFDAEVVEINAYEMYLDVDVFGENHLYIVRNDSLPEVEVGTDMIVAMEMHDQECPETWEIRGMRDE